MQAEAGLEALRECVDTVITIPNERLLSIIDRKTTLTDAFTLADDVLRQAIQGISDLILVPGLINLDFADVKTIMSGMGVAMMGTGTSEGDGRAMQAAQKAISSPLLEDSSVHGARGVIINVTGGSDLSLVEVNEASCVIQEAAHEDANIIFGAVVDPQLVGTVKITVIATGFDRKAAARQAPAAASETPTDLNIFSAHLSRAAEVPQQVANGSVARTRAMASAAEAPVMTHTSALQQGAPPAVGVNRRPVVELSLSGLGTSERGVSAGENVFEASTPLDVPAFLRRQT
jgi:cell division GTPase FtsZ